MSENIPPEISETPDNEIVIVKEGGVVTEYSKSYGNLPQPMPYIRHTTADL